MKYNYDPNCTGKFKIASINEDEYKEFFTELVGSYCILQEVNLGGDYNVYTLLKKRSDRKGRNSSSIGSFSFEYLNEFILKEVIEHYKPIFREKRLNKVLGINRTYIKGSLIQPKYGINIIRIKR